MAELIGQRLVNLCSATNGASDAAVDLRHYRLQQSKMDVVFMPVPGALVSATVVVPTRSFNHSGLAHTLEHLVFCGSERYPNRGFLDMLATRSYSTGTNAYTCEDHTGYTIVTAGAEGMCNILPVFLDHILHPTLRDAQFLTEVCHEDSAGRLQGVVYCEMAARENSEADLLDLNLRVLIYGCLIPPNDEDPEWLDLLRSYSFECGGRTIDIQRLTNEYIRSYHQHFYRPDRLAVIICGESISGVNLTTLLDRLDASCEAPSGGSNGNQLAINHSQLIGRHQSETGELLGRESHLSVPIVRQSLANPQFPVRHVFTRTVRFPSADTEYGSVGFAWIGPALFDLKTCIAIDVLFRYLQGTSASPLQQAFVETEEPLANDVDMEIKPFLQTCIFLLLSGVPMQRNNDDESSFSDSDGSNNDDNESHESEEEEQEEEDESNEPISRERAEEILAEYRQKLFEVLDNVVCDGIPPAVLQSTIQRHRVKYYESIEDDPHAVCGAYLVPDILLRKLSKDQPAETIGTRFQIPDILNELESEPGDYWKSLAERWFVNVQYAQVLMTPDSQLAADLESAEQQAIQQRLSTADAAVLQSRLDNALRENSVNLPAEMIQLMPQLPTLAESETDSSQFEVVDFPVSATPFSKIQLVQLRSSFQTIKICLPTTVIPAELQPYMVLFQELLFQSPLYLRDSKERENALRRAASIGHQKISSSSPSDEEQLLLDYQALVKLLANDLVHFECGVGFGNDTFSCSWLSEIFMIHAQCEFLDNQRLDASEFPFCTASDSTTPGRFSQMITWLVRILFTSQFTVSRIKTIATNLSSSITELKREGSDMVSALLGLVSGRVQRGSSWDTPLSSADRSDLELNISIFAQEQFLRSVLDRIAAGEGEAVVAELNRLRDCLVVSNQPAAAVPVGFIQIAGPNALDESTQLVEKLGKVWTEFSQQCQSPAAIVGHKRLANGKRKMESAATCFPHPRVPFSIPKSLKTRNELALMIPLPGITSSYLLQMVPCDVLSVGGEHHEDFMPLQVLTSLLSRSEGPLYSEIRGRGLAYDAVLSTYLWAGMLVFEVFDAREPVCALERFWSIINQYAKASDKQWDFDDAESMSSSGSDSLLFRKHDFESAIASLIYRLYAEVSTPMGQASETLKASIRGFRSLTELRSVPSVSRVTAKDLQRVFRRYFMQFLDRNNRITLLLTPPSPPDSYQTVRLSAGDVDCSLQFTAIDSIEVFFRQFQ